MRRVMIWTLALLLTLGGVALGATAMGLKVNGTNIALTHAPEYRDGVLMVPADDVAKALGVEVKVNAQTNTVEFTDTRTAKIAELEAKVKNLEAKVAPATPPPVPVTAANLLDTLNQKYSVFKHGTRTITVQWTTLTLPSAGKVFLAEMGPASYLEYLYLSLEDRQPLLDWFKEASGLIKSVHGNEFSATLVMYDTRTNYPSTRYDHVDLTSDFKWRITEYIIWALNIKGELVVQWDTDQR